MLAFTQQDGREGEVNLVDPARCQVLADHRDTAADANILVFALGRVFGFLVERPLGKIVIDTTAPATLAMHLLEYLSVLEPPMQLEAADSEGIVQVLPGPSTEAVE